jgi:MFS family permease
MAAIGTAIDVPVTDVGILDRERIIARPGFNRWLVPPAALCIHLCIGMAYGFSVFWLPLSRAIGISKTVPCPDMTLVRELFTTTCDWRVASLGWMYTLFFVVLGVAAAIWGGWLERAGPRKAGVVAALCWCGGLVLGAIGIYAHQLWLMWLGSGVIGGIGLGLGYISPVSTLVKWFPDRRGMATGMAIMGFGGGAMIGAPLANLLMNGGDFISAPFADLIARAAELIDCIPIPACTRASVSPVSNPRPMSAYGRPFSLWVRCISAS